MNFQPPDPPEVDEGERFEHELSELQRAAENLAAIDAGESQASESDAVSIFTAAARPSLIVWLFKDRERQAEEYDKAWRHDLNDKKNVQVLSAEVARLKAECEQLSETCMGQEEVIETLRRSQ